MKSADDRNTALEDAKKNSWDSLKELWNIFKKYGTQTNAKKLSSTPKETAKLPSKKYVSLKILQFIPGLLILLFVVSFFWDFNDISYRFLNHTFQFQGLLRILSVSGLIGYGTNWLAITMLFKPTHKRPILGHGLIPAQKERISVRLAQAVSDDLINPEIIKQKIHESDAISRYRKISTRYIKQIIDKPGFRSDLKTWTVQYVEDMIANPEVRTAIAKNVLTQIENSIQETTLERAAFRAYTFIKGQEMQQIIEEALTQLPASVEGGLERFDIFLDNLPAHIEKNSTAIEQVVTSALYTLVNQLDVKKMVEEKLKSYDEQQISSLIKNATNEQLRYIQYLGAVLGVIGGLIIWEPLYCLILLIALGAAIFALDYLMFYYQ